MPRVGSSSSSTARPRRQATWPAPPSAGCRRRGCDRRCVDARRPDAQVRAPARRATCRSSAPGRRCPSGECARRVARRDVLAHAGAQDQPLPLAVLGHAGPCRPSMAWTSGGRGAWPPQTQSRQRRTSAPTTARSSSVRPAPTRPASPAPPRRDREADVANDPAATTPLDPSSSSPRRPRSPGVLLDASARPSAARGRRAVGGRRSVADGSARRAARVTRSPMRGDLLEVVGDVDDGDARAPELAHQARRGGSISSSVSAAVGSSRIRIARLERSERLGDLARICCRAMPSSRTRVRGIDAQPAPRGHGSARLRRTWPTVHDTEPARRASEQDVLGRR